MMWCSLTGQIFEIQKLKILLDQLQLYRRNSPQQGSIMISIETWLFRDWFKIRGDF